MQSHDLQSICERLDALQRQRKFYIKLRNQQTNAAGGLVRQVMKIPKEPTDDVSAKDIDRMKAVALDIVAGKSPEGWEHITKQVAGPIAAVRITVEPLEKARKAVELEMKKTVRKCPVAKWAYGIRGFGEVALAVILAESGDLSRYPDRDRPVNCGPATLWKRLGLAPFQGKAYSTWRKVGGLSSEDWVNAGYSPKRLAEVFSCLTTPLFKHQTMISGPYRLIYDARRVRTFETHPDWSKGQSHNDALRIMTKSLISDLWSEWRRAIANVSEETGQALLDAYLFQQAAE